MIYKIIPYECKGIRKNYKVIKLSYVYCTSICINLVSIFNILKSALKVCAISYLSNMALFFSFITPSSCNVYHSNVKKKKIITNIVLWKKVEYIDFVLLLCFHFIILDCIFKDISQ